MCPFNGFKGGERNKNFDCNMTFGEVIQEQSVIELVFGDLSMEVMALVLETCMN